ncbi:hypothetical protein MYU51_011933 [Penicillium brevicompactum]
MPPRRIRKLGGSTDESVNWLNNPTQGARSLPDPKKRRVTNETAEYDLPVSPEQLQRQAQNERNLRSRRRTARREPSQDISTSEDQEEEEDPSDAESESDIELPDANDAPTPTVVIRNVRQEEVNPDDGQQVLENENEADPLPGPIELFTTEDEDTAIDDAVNGDGNQVDDLASATEVQINTGSPGLGYDAGSDARPNTGSLEKDEDMTINDLATGTETHYRNESPGADALDPEFEADSDNESSAEPQTSADSTSKPRSAGEIQIPESSVQTRLEHPQPIHKPSNTSQSSQIHSAQPSRIAESLGPTTQPSSNGGHTRPSHEIFTWLASTIEESGFKRTWDVLHETRRTSKQKADPPMRERFAHIRRMNTRMQGLYEELTQSNTPTTAMRDLRGEQCTLIANNIFNELQWIIFQEARDEPSKGGALVNQVEAHVIPWLIELVYFGFQAWKTWNEKGKVNWLRRHFRISLDLLWGSSYKIASYSDVTYGERNVPTPLRGLMSAVKAIKDALNNGRLRELGGIRSKPPYRHFELTEVTDNISLEPWSRDEKDALRKAFESAVVNGFKGENPLCTTYMNITNKNTGDYVYIDIKCGLPYGDTLSDRLFRQVKEQAVKLGLVEE